MISDLPGFVSVNKLESLPSGRYFVVESIYQPAAESSALVTMSEILTVAGNRTVAVDLQVLTDEGELRFRDFCLTASGAWRDSYGATAWKLQDLLPSELAKYTLTSRQGTVVDHDGHGNLLQVPAREQNYGA